VRRVAVLQELGFEFEDEAAEWGRWFRELAAAADERISPAFGSSEALLLTNWHAPLTRLTLGC